MHLDGLACGELHTRYVVFFGTFGYKPKPFLRQPPAGQAQTKHAVSVLPLRITAKTARKAFVSLAVNLSVCKFIYFLFKSINVLPEYGK